MLTYGGKHSKRVLIALLTDVKWLHFCLCLQQNLIKCSEKFLFLKKEANILPPCSSWINWKFPWFPWKSSVTMFLETFVLSTCAKAATGGVLLKAVIKNFAIFTGKNLCWSLFLMKLQTCKIWILRNFSIAVLRVLFDFGFKKIIQQMTSVFTLVLRPL